MILPAALTKAGAKVPSFAFVPEKQSMAHSMGPVPDNRNGPYGAYNYNDLKEAYDYPSYAALDGTGANVAIVMESNASNDDVAAMFNHEHYTTTTGKAPPTYIYVPIDGGGTYGGVNDGGTDEAELDVQMVLGGAPGANVSLLSVPNLADSHIFDAYFYVIETGAFDIVSNSFGECELFYTAAYNNGFDATYVLQIYDEFYAIGNMEGTTWFVSSGDEGGLQCPQTKIVPHFIGLTGGPNVNFIKGVSTPAASPYVTAVGGGNLQTSFTPPAGSSLPSTYIGENGFGDPEVPYDEFGLGVNLYGGYWGAGGGVSSREPQPDYQVLANTGVNTGSTTMRTVPDIGMLVGGCPFGISKQPCHPGDSAVVVTIGAPPGSNGVGYRYGFIGTSVSSPELAGALALAVQYYGGRFGNINYDLYPIAGIQTAAGGASAPAADQFFHMGIPGFDGANSGGGTYNYIYGNGSPDVRTLFGLSVPAAGDPRTPSNP
jgi:subtilase family serine protease